MNHQCLVAVTGATGFVGRHLVRELLAAGQTVRMLVRTPEKAGEFAGRVEFVEGGLGDLDALEKLVFGAKIVIHCAGAIAGLDRQAFFSVNETGAGNVARAANQAGVERFVHVSSMAARVPQLSWYTASKNAGEKAVAEFIPADQLAIVRPPAVYGPEDVATLPLIKILMGSFAILPGHADQRISWIFVKDLAKALVAVGVGKPPVCGTFELDDGHENGYSWAELVGSVAKAQDRQIKLFLLPRFIVTIASWFAAAKSKLTQKPDVFSTQKVNEIYFSDWVAHCREIPGWKPETGFADGFAVTLQWYQENGWLPGGRDKAKRLDKSVDGEPLE
jgi:nucleoside-diphosphate-sugar epimerase